MSAATLGELGRVAEALEHRVEVVHRVPDLVDAQLLGLAQRARRRRTPPPRRSTTIAAPEERNSPLLTRSCSLVVNTVRSVVGSNAVDELDRPSAAASRHASSVGEALDDEEPVAVVASDLLVGQHGDNRTFAALRSRRWTLTIPSPRPTMPRRSPCSGARCGTPIDHVEVFPAPANVADGALHHRRAGVAVPGHQPARPVARRDRVRAGPRGASSRRA